MTVLSYATVFHAKTGKLVDVPFEGGYLEAKAYFERIGIKVSRTYWYKSFSKVN
jgi:hypothetical protein